MDADRTREALRVEVLAVRSAISTKGASEGAATISNAEQMQRQQHQAVEGPPPPKKRRNIRSTRCKYVIF